MKKIFVLLTFDYELPLGEADDYNRSLFSPAESLIELANDLKVPIVLFADVCSSFCFRKWGELSYAEKFESQLQRSIKEGHDVQLHIHPHWLTSTYTSGRFIPSSNYSLSHYKNPIDGLDIERICETAYQELTRICRSASADYQCIAFRAGGYDVEPESARIMSKLYDLGIRFDSSVIKDFFLDYGYSRVDYRGAPKASSWRISKSGRMITPSSDGLVELPIASMPTKVQDIVLRRVKKILKKEVYASRKHKNGGKGLLTVQGKQNIDGFIRKLFNPTILSFDKEHLEYADLAGIVSYLEKQYESESNDLVVTAIGHPKSMGPYHLELLTEFVKRSREQFGDRIAFTTYPELLKQGYGLN